MTDRNPTVVVTSDESLPEVVERLRTAANGGQTVDLVVPIDSALLLTAREFRTLKEAIDDRRLPVVVRTADPLRLHLAERLGIRVQALPRPRAAPPEAVAPTVPSDVHTPAPQAAEVWPGPTSPAPAVVKVDPESHWPDQNGAGAGAETDEVEPEPEVDADTGLFAGNPPRRWLPVAAALALLVVLAVVGIRYVVPQAIVTFVPRTAPVAASLLFDVTSDGRPLDAEAAFAVTPQKQTVEVVWEGSAPVTGVRVEPDGTASGPIELRNSSAEPLQVDAGTLVATELGVEFAFSAAVTVPAADPATGEPGAATGQVQAVQPGAGGNVGTGELGGRLPNGVYYSNRMEPAAGGSDKEFPVVAEADVAALSAAAKAAAPELVAAAVTTTEPGAAVLPSTVTVTAQNDELSHDVGAEVPNLSIRSTLTVEVLTYDGDAAREAYEPALLALLNDVAPEGFAVAVEEIEIGEPVATKTSDGAVRVEVAAESEAAAVLDEAERDALAAELAGASAEDAAAILAKRPEVAEVTVSYQPSWLPRQMPNTAGRIEFEVAP